MAVDTDVCALAKMPKRHIAIHGKKILHIMKKVCALGPRIMCDVGVAAWVLDPTTREPNLIGLVQKYLSDEPATIKEAAQFLFQLASRMEQELRLNSLDKIFYEMEMPLLPVLVHMEEKGVLLDRGVLHMFSEILEKRLREREEKIYELAGCHFNINSPKQLTEVLFEKLGIAQDGIRKTDGGVRSTRASELAKLGLTHPIAKEVLMYREEMKLKSTYVDVLPTLVNSETGKIHTTFNQTGTVTGRLSSQDPNLQNIPIRTSLGQEIRRAFVASPGYELLSFDYSQIELRLAASLSGDERMIEAFRTGKDIHTMTAALVGGVEENSVTPIMRRAAKTINFGILYGMGAMSLAENLGISHKEADTFIREYFMQFPHIKTYLEETKRKAAEQGYVETLFGRRRYFKNISQLGWQARREAERMAINAPIQGSDADIVKTAMIRIFHELKDGFLCDEVRMLLQVHDELLFEVRTEKRGAYADKIRFLMETIVHLQTPLTVEVRWGANWYELMK